MRDKIKRWHCVEIWEKGGLGGEELVEKVIKSLDKKRSQQRKIYPFV